MSGPRPATGKARSDAVSGEHELDVEVEVGLETDDDQDGKDVPTSSLDQPDLEDGDVCPEEGDVTGTADLTATARQRDEYLDSLRRLQAEFENFKKRVSRQQGEYGARANEALVVKLLAVLDTADMAQAHGTDSAGVTQVATALDDVLSKEGLERIDPEVGSPFDPNEHDAVMHEDGEEGPLVSEVLRAGYRFQGRVVRPAMVKVRG